MDFERLDEIARGLMKKRKAHRERESGSIYEHGQRVARLVITLRRAVVPQDSSMDDILRLAGMFHDVGKALEPHAEYGAPIMLQAVKGIVSDKEAQEAARLIASHCDRRPGEPVHDVWARLIQDADLLDHIGTYTVWMDIQNAAYRDEGPAWMAEQFGQHAEEYADHCRRLFNFPVSLELYEDRIAFYLEFARRFIKEAAGEIYRPEA